MIPTIAEANRCPKCGSKLNHFGGTDYCQNCGQSGVGHRGASCPAGCDPHLAVSIAGIGGAGKRCNGCGRQW
jgi:hypothetical protein